MYVWKNSSGNLTLAKRVPVGRFTFRNNTTGLTLTKGTLQIGKGAYGTVNAYYNSTGKHAFTIKQQSDDIGNEIRLMRRIKRIVPSAVPAIHSGMNSQQLVTNFIKGGSLDTWIVKNKPSDTDVCLIIIQVLKILQKISTKNPTFRHNDLHCGNILVDNEANKQALNNTGIRMMLTDFGLSRDSLYHCAQFEGSFPDEDFKEYLEKEYGIYVGNDKMYDAAFFLRSIRAKITSQKMKNVIGGLFKGVKLVHERLAPGQKFTYSYRDLLSFFNSFVYNTINTNLNTSLLYKNNRKNLDALSLLAKVTPQSNLIRMNLRVMFPRVTNQEFLKHIKFIPKAQKKQVTLPKQFKSPSKLKNSATLGASRFKTKNIKTSKRRVPSPQKFDFVKSPFNPKKFNSMNVTKTRPVNVENYFIQKGKTLSNAKNTIERIVRMKRKEAWEKAQEMLKGQVKISRR